MFVYITITVFGKPFILQNIGPGTQTDIICSNDRLKKFQTETDCK